MWKVMAALSATGWTSPGSKVMASHASKDCVMKARISSRPLCTPLGYGSTCTASSVKSAA